MTNRIHKNRYMIFAAIIVVAIGVLVFINYLYAENYPGGKYFQTQWIATRGVLAEGLSPYSDQILYKIQTSAYGRPAMSGEYEFRFTYPYFSLILFTPFALIKDFVIARALWMTILEILLIGIFFLSINLVNWKIKLLPGIAIFLISVTFYHNIRAIVDGNLLLFVTFFLLAALIAIRDRKDEAAGLLLAIATIEIKYIFLGLALLIVYLIVNRRFKTIGSFFGGLVILYGFSFLLLPEWLGEYSRQLVLSISRDPFGSFDSLLRNVWGELGGRISITVTILSSLVILIESFYVKIASFKRFLWIIFLTLVVSQWTGLPAESKNFILLFPGLVYSLKLVTERWQNKGETIVILIGAILYLSTWIVFFLLRDEKNLYYDPGIFFVILPVAEFLLLYWSRWWVIRGKTIAYKSQ